MLIRISGLLAVSGLALLAGCGQNASTLNTTVTTKAAQQAMTPDAVLADLKAGNARFVAGKNTEQNWLSQAATTARDGQYPKAIVLSCLDSRVPPEIVFDQGIGDIFVGRVAGNFENTDMLGSMEFGTAAAGAKLIVVLGHTACGAVKGTMDNAQLGNLTATLENIKPATAVAPGAPSSDKAALARVTEENVRITMRDILSRSPVLAERVSNGQLKIVGGVYDLATGRVNWIDG
jgi:Carbonic anhydrase